jgi:aminopeptidase N
MDLYFARHDNSAVTIEEFVQAMQDAAGIDLGHFKRWYAQAGTPVLTVEDSFDPNTGRYVLTIAQETAPTPEQPVKAPFMIPLAMGLIDPGGAELPTRLSGEANSCPGTRILSITAARQSFCFEDLPAAPVPSLLRGFSAPVKLKGMSIDKLKFLAEHDGDEFARWDAGQEVLTRQLLALVRSIQRGEAPSMPDDLINSFRRRLADPALDPGFVAEILALPCETMLADEMPVVDVEAIHTARTFLRRTIGHDLAAELTQVYEALSTSEPYRPDALSMGKRALRNACLAYLVAGTEDGIARAKAQFDAGQNMTDVLAALTALSEIDCPERLVALEQFHRRWRAEELVVNKWLMLQATSPLPDTLERCRALLAHPDFDRLNPNRVRALIGAFAQDNPRRFHESSGAGYVFLADEVIAIDAQNPTLAARLVQSLGAWRRHDPRRQGLMKGELQRILNVASLSKGSYEMVSKSLA